MASVANAHDADGSSLGPVGTRHGDSAHLIRTRPSKAPPLVLVSEAGPCGDWLDRDLTHKGDDGWVVAPSRMPHQAGDRVNTDRRDAVPLARVMRSGDLTPVEVPRGADDAIRDRTRARAEALSALNAATFRRNAF